MNSFTVTLPLPPSVNALYRNVARKGRVKTGVYKAWQTRARIALNAQKPPKLQPPYSVLIACDIDHRSDISNRIKAVEDLLVDYGCISDDRWIEKVSAARVAMLEAECRVTVAGGFEP